VVRAEPWRLARPVIRHDPESGVARGRHDPTVAVNWNAVKSNDEIICLLNPITLLLPIIRVNFVNKE
jgi:hypothetical protein